MSRTDLEVKRSNNKSMRLLSGDVDGVAPDLDDSLEYLEVVTKHLSVVMVTVTHNELQHLAD